MARSENAITKWWLARLIRRATAMDEAEALAWLDRVRRDAAGGSWSILPDDTGILSMASHMLPASMRPRRGEGQGGRRVPGRSRAAGFLLCRRRRVSCCRRRRASAPSPTSLPLASAPTPVMGAHRLAPEHPHPLPVEDLAGHYRSLIEDGVPETSIVVGGDSAGATLLLSMLLMLRERGEPMPAGALLFSPWTDLAMRGWSYVTKGVSSDSPFRMETAAFAARLYLGDTLPTAPEASPAYADLEGFPPIAVHCSPLRHAFRRRRPSRRTGRQGRRPRPRQLLGKAPATTSNASAPARRRRASSLRRVLRGDGWRGCERKQLNPPATCLARQTDICDL